MDGQLTLTFPLRVHFASYLGHHECILTLLSRAKTGSDVDEQDEDELTALHLASYRRHKECRC